VLTKDWQENPIPESKHNAWKNKGEFKDGMAIIAGKVWHRPDKLGQYLVVIDLDRKRAIEEFCTISGKIVSLNEMAQKFIVEQHMDDKERAHIYFYSPFSFAQKTHDPIVGIEVKKTSFCCPSIHANKDSQDRKEWRYEILAKPIVPISLT
jgi:hypothetical protein